MNLAGSSQSTKRQWVALAGVALFLVWLALLASGLTTAAINPLRPSLPGWFPTLSLVLLPVLAFISGASSPIRVEMRLLAWVLTLCCMSAMYLSYHVHPVAYLVVLALFLIEAFVVVPRWNGYRHRKLGQPAPEAAPSRSRALDYLVYVLAGLAVAACLIYAVLARP